MDHPGARQAEEILRYGGEEFHLLDYPLSAFLQEQDIDIHGLVKNWSKDCRRGYQGEWEIKANQLYLTELYDVEGKNLLGRLFKNQIAPVSAKWFTGKLRAHKGSIASGDDDSTDILTIEVCKGMTGKQPEQAIKKEDGKPPQRPSASSEDEGKAVPPSTSQPAQPVNCAPLMQVATPEVFRGNPFRITGLPIHAGLREISKHADKLKMMEEFGAGKDMHSAAFALEPPPSIDQIRAAIQRLKDPEHRFLDEFFWFWPRSSGHGASDPALCALNGGDSDTALQIWTSLETSPAEGIVAMHNMAILWHLNALDWENYLATTGQSTPDQWQQTESCWQRAFQRWQILTTDDLFWDRLRGRVREVDDPRLTTGFLRRMRVVLPFALAKINAELAVRHFSGGRIECAKAHVRFARAVAKDPIGVAQVIETVLDPFISRLRHQVEQTRERAAADPAIGVSVGRELLGHAALPLALLDLFFGDARARNELADELASLCNLLQVAYDKVTDKAQPCLDLLREVLPLATTDETRRRIEANIAVLVGRTQRSSLEPIFKLLNDFHDDQQLPAIRFQEFQLKIAPRLRSIDSGIVGSEAHTGLLNDVGFVLRGLALTAWNTHQDHATALAVTQSALTYVLDKELRQRLDADLTTLQQISARKEPLPPVPTPPAKSSNSGCIILLVIFGIFGFLALIGSNSTPGTGSSPTTTVSSSSYSTPAPSGYSTPTTTYSTPAPMVHSTPDTPQYFIAPTPSFVLPSATPTKRTRSAATPSVTLSTSDGRVYRVPMSYTAELSRDRQAMETTLARMNADNEQVQAFSDEIERERQVLNRESQAAVNSFNRNVNLYNAALEQQRQQNRVYNQMVDTYNAKLQRYGR